jgi:hypothetical protein
VRLVDGLAVALEAGSLAPLATTRNGSLSLAGLAVGLGLGNHLSVLLFAPAVADWLWRNRRLLHRGAACGAILAGLVGLAVYLYLPAAAAGDPP